MNNKLNKVLVTGGAGCIGLPLCDELIKRGKEVVLYDLSEQIFRVKDQINKKVQIYYGSILDESSIREAIRGCDGVVHLAAYLGVRRTEINKIRCLDININGTRTVLDAAIKHNLKKVVFASSSEVYGEPIKNPITEDDITQGKTIYAVSKLAGEELVKAYNAEFYFLNYSVVRYFNTYGPHQIAQFVISKFIRNVLDGRPPIIYGDGRQKRSYCFSHDSARATVDTLLSNQTNGEVINIGNSNSVISLYDLAKLVIQLSGQSDKLDLNVKNSFENSDRDSSREIYQRFCSTEKAKKLINYEPKYSLEYGIKAILEVGALYPDWATTEKNYIIDESL